jgi:hypothetical protein
MTLYLSNRDGVGGTSLTNEEGHYRFQTQSWTGNIVMGSGDELAVTQNSPLGMSVLIGTGDFKIDTTGYSYTGWNSASLVATVSTANPSNPREDAVVLYVDKSENTPGTANNPGIIKQMVVAGTPAGSPVAPDDTAISTAVGAGNPYIRLANVTVGTGVTQITNANIASTRVLAAPKLPANSVTTTAIADSNVTTTKIADASVTAAKIDFASGIWWEEIGRGSNTNQTSLTVSFVAKTHLSVRLSWVPSVSLSTLIRFNSDSGSNYGYTNTMNSGSVTSNSSLSQTSINPLGVASGNSNQYVTMDIFNVSGSEKVAAITSARSASGASGQPIIVNTVGHWTGTAQISSITITASTGNLGSASIVVLGHD